MNPQTRKLMNALDRLKERANTLIIRLSQEGDVAVEEATINLLDTMDEVQKRLERKR